jgi:hypothetical protein
MTIHAARALGLDDRGSSRRDAADFVAWDVAHPNEPRTGSGAIRARASSPAASTMSAPVFTLARGKRHPGQPAMSAPWSDDLVPGLVPPPRLEDTDWPRRGLRLRARAGASVLVPRRRATRST